MSEHSSTIAASITVSLSPSDDRTTSAVATTAYRSYLRRAHRGPVSVGDEWEEFVNCGCGTTRNVTLRVESITGGESVGEDTEFVFEASNE